MPDITLGILTTTTHQVDSRKIRQYLGIIGSEVLVTIENWLDGGAAATRYGRRQALELLAQRAQERGATVVLAIDFGYVPVGLRTLLVTATGTAVRL